jgi:hypothetical protein
MVISAWKTRGVTSIGGEWTKIPNFEANLNDIVDPSRDSPQIWGTLRRYINGMHGWQLDWDVMKCILDQIDPLYKDVGNWTTQVLNTLLNDNPRKYVIGISSTSSILKYINQSSGHALAPYEVTKIGDDYYILCYDPNRPLSENVMNNHGSYIKYALEEAGNLLFLMAKSGKTVIYQSYQNPNLWETIDLLLLDGKIYPKVLAYYFSVQIQNRLRMKTENNFLMKKETL